MKPDHTKKDHEQRIMIERLDDMATAADEFLKAYKLWYKALPAEDKATFSRILADKARRKLDED